MTSQTKTFIELADIVGVRLECNECHVSLLVNEQNLVNLASSVNQNLIGCPTCNHPWTWIGTQPRGYDTDIKELIRAINKVKELESNLGVKMTLEISVPDSCPA